jgi:hypothetical protein
MFDIMKNLDMLQERLKKKNRLSTGRKLFKGTFDKYKIEIIVGYQYGINDPASKRHIFKNRFYLSDIDKDARSINYYELGEFITLLHKRELFDDFKFTLEEKLLGDV